jgi:hypothetical protein
MDTLRMETLKILPLQRMYRESVSGGLKTSIKTPLFLRKLQLML